MKHKKVLLFFTALLLSLFLIYGCGGITGKATAVGEQPKIKIGALLPLSGDAAAYGENVKQGIELALKGTNFEVIYEDGKCEGPDAVTAIQKLINLDGVVGVIGVFVGVPHVIFIVADVSDAEIRDIV